MINGIGGGATPLILPAPVLDFDPAKPIQRSLPASASETSAPGQNQRQRRAMILATIRALLVDEGFDGVTVRRVAECSGHAVQTIYNLVGPRDLAITEAISEYSTYVCLTGTPNPRDPAASVTMIDRELNATRTNPEFCRNVCMIFFSGSRQIYYDFRERQTRNLQAFLAQQQKLGIIRPDVNVRDLAERIMLFASAIFIEWADRPFTFEVLQQRLYATHAPLMSEVVNPAASRMSHLLS